MKKYILRNIFLFTALIVTLTACFDTITQSEEGILTDFYFSDRTGVIGLSEIEFVITPPATSEDTGLITNPYDLFPYGILQDSIAARYVSEGASYVLWLTDYEVKDTLGNVTEVRDTFFYLTSGSTAVDFSDTALFQVISEDGNNATYYHVVINDDPVNPESLNWTQKNAAVDFGLTQHFNGFYLNNKIFVLTGDIVPEADSVYTKLVYSEDGSIWTEVNLPTDFPRGIYHSLKVYNDVVYMVGYVGWDEATHRFIGKEEIWTSTDGIIWNKMDYPAGMGSVFKNIDVFNGALMVWGGSAVNETAANVTAMPYATDGSLIDPDNTVWTYDGNTWSQGANMPDNMGIRFSASTFFEDRGQVFGGELADGSNTNTFWAYETLNNWKEFPIKDEFEALAQTSLVNYDRKLWLFGGINEEGYTNNSIMVSFNEGLKFTSVFDINDVDLSPGLNYSMRANQLVLLTPDKTIYVIGGVYKSATTIFTESGTEIKILDTPLLDVWEGKMVKFSN